MVVETHFFERSLVGRRDNFVFLCRKEAEKKEQDLSFPKHKKLLKMVHYSKSYKGFGIKGSGCKMEKEHGSYA